ncbi:MAG: sugar phosphate isomerase/epimerase [Alistipes sp.]|nr:sugar phosphate isomerase/epimerase [Alistipes sp.]
MKRLFSYAIVVMAAAVMAGFTGCAGSKKVGLQLYSVHQDMGDVAASLQKVADAGYNVVETLGSPNCFGMPADEFRKLCNDKGLQIISTHTSIGMDDPNAMQKWHEVFAGLKTMGASYCVIPGFNLGRNLEELKAVCNYFNEVGKIGKEYGIKLGYHNHSHEYNEMEGQVMWEYMIENTDPDLVFFQMDVYWTTRGGKDPVEYLKKYPKRIHMLHIKDELVIGDSGKIDFEAIFKQFYKNGWKDYVVEQEMPYDRNSSREQNFERMWDGVAKSAAYLNNAKFVK